MNNSNNMGKFNSITNKALVLALLAASCNAFVPSNPTASAARPFVASHSNMLTSSPPHTSKRLSPRFATTSSAIPESDEVTRLKKMAAKLRDEAAALEVEQKKAIAKAAEQVFRRFDTDRNGQVSATELQTGLEKMFKIELPEKRAKELIQAFDANQDGALQLEEFAGVDAFRNKLDALVREERSQAREQAKQALAQAQAAEIAEKQMELVNDKPPTTSDKIVSVLPYLFPLVDGLQFARFFIEGNPENPLATAALIAYGLYRAIPLSGFLSFFALNFLSENPQLNKLVRFNMQQAVFLDFALFVPALVVALTSGLLNQVSGMSIPPSVVELGNDAMFLTLLATIGYASVSSLAGQLPNKLPFISQRVQDRMISAEDMAVLFDDEGRFAPFDKDGNLKKSPKNDDETNNDKKD